MKPKQPWLFPEIAQEIHDDRSAILRKAAQVTRHHKRKAEDYLKGRDTEWIIDYLIDNGPQTEFALMHERMDCELDEIGGVFADVWSLWRVGRLWRASQGKHPAVGEVSFLYGIRGVHAVPDKNRNRCD